MASLYAAGEKITRLSPQLLKLNNRFIISPRPPLPKENMQTFASVPVAQSFLEKKRLMLMIDDSFLRGTESSVYRPDNLLRKVICLPRAKIKDVTENIPK